MESEENGIPRQPNRIIVILGLFGMTLLPILLGWFVFTRTSLRLDEAQSLFQTSRDIPGLLYMVAQDVHVPFYHLLLHFWQIIFGGDITSARFLSLVFFAGSVPLTYYLGKYAFSERVGLFAALLMSISPFMNWYGSEARMYAMLAFITVMHQIFFLKFFREGKNIHLLWYLLTAITGLYTHYFFIFVLLTELVYSIFKRKNFAAGNIITKGVISAGVLAGTFLPWLYYVYHLGTASNTQPKLETPSSGDLFDTYAQFIFGFQIDNLNTIIVSLWPIIVLLAFFALQKNRKTPPEVIFMVFAAVLPVLAAFIISITLHPFYLSRYLIVSLPGLFIFIAWIFSNYPQRLALAMKSALLALLIIMLGIQIMNPNTPVKENYSEAVAYISENASSQDVIIASAPFTIYPIEYYYNGEAKVTTQPIWNRFSQGAIPPFDKQKLPAETKQITASYQKAWLVLSFDQGYNADLKEYYDKNFQRIDEKEFSPKLNVYTYKLRYDPPVSLQ